jgi:hypothetical protein
VVEDFRQRYLFCQHVLERIDLQATIGKQALESSIFLFEVAQPLCGTHLHAAVLFAPFVERVFGNAMCATQRGEQTIAGVSLP